MLSGRLVGGPTLLFEFAGLRWLTDPAFSPPGEYSGLTKLSGPALGAEEVGAVDAVLLSHDQHADNLDPAGRELLATAGLVLTTEAGAERLGGTAVGLAPWATHRVGDAVVTAVPALHGPPGFEPESGPVIGFVLDAGAGRVYVSGDNASVDVVREIAERCGPIEVAVLFAGAVQIPTRAHGAYLTLSSDRAAEAARVLSPRAAIPIHYEGWSHFTQGADALRAAFAGNGVSGLLHLVEPGGTVSVSRPASASASTSG